MWGWCWRGPWSSWWWRSSRCSSWPGCSQGCRSTAGGPRWAAVILLALLNAVLRPLVLLVAANLGIIVFTLIAFLLNAVVVHAGRALGARIWRGRLGLGLHRRLRAGRPERADHGDAQPQRRGLPLPQRHPAPGPAPGGGGRGRAPGGGRGADRRPGRGGAAGGAGGGAHAHPGPLAEGRQPPPGGLGVRRALHDQRGAGRPLLRQQRRDPRLPLVRQGHREDVRLQPSGGRPGPGPAPGHRGRPVRGGPPRGRGEHQQPPHRGGRDERDDHGRDGHGRGQAPDQHARLLHLPGQPLQLTAGPDGLHRRRLRGVLAGLASGAQEGRAPDAPRGGLPLPARGDHRPAARRRRVADHRRHVPRAAGGLHGLPGLRRGGPPRRARHGGRQGQPAQLRPPPGHHRGRLPPGPPAVRAGRPLRPRPEHRLDLQAALRPLPGRPGAAADRQGLRRDPHASPRGAATRAGATSTPC